MRDSLTVGLSDNGTLIVVAIVGAAAAIIAAFAGVFGPIITNHFNHKRDEGRKQDTQTAAAEVKQSTADTAAALAAQWDTGNGHTPGQALSRLEDQSAEIVQRLDKAEVRGDETHELLRRHLEEVGPSLEAWRKAGKPVRD